jgi:lipid-binding SYLF domain-containing protein
MTTSYFLRGFLAPACAAIILITMAGCYTPTGATKADKQTSIQNMSRQALVDLYKEKPSVKDRLEKAAGYAVFSNLNLRILAVGSGQGYGMAVDNATKKRTYMRMMELGGGFGLGVSDFRAIMVFHDPKAFKNFLDVGLEFTGKAGAEAQAGDQGMAARQEAKMAGAGEEDVQLFQGVEVYQLTKNGLMYQAMLYGTKYWKDNELN